MAVKIKLNLDDIGNINFFENVTKLKVKDCFFDDIQNKLVFVVMPQEIKKLLNNKFGVEKIKFIEEKIKKKLRIIEFNENPIVFVKNAVLPLKVDDVVFQNETNTIIIKSQDRSVKSMIIGKNASSLNNLKNLVARYFSNIADIRVE